MPAECNLSSFTVVIMFWHVSFSLSLSLQSFIHPFYHPRACVLILTLHVMVPPLRHALASLLTASCMSSIRQLGKRLQCIHALPSK